MDLKFQKIKKNLNKLNIKNNSILIAFSGGKDSVFLLNALLALKEEFTLKLNIGYINHNLRDDSAKEEDFVKNTANKFNLPLYIYSIKKNEWQNLNRESVESKARKIRYKFLKETAKENKIDYIATAHHLNDRIETYFINFLRAGGLDTFRAIPFKNKNIIRPILNITSHEIRKYLSENEITFYEDKTNKENIYKRNIIRNKFLPVFKELHPDFEKSFSHVFNFIEEEQDFIKSYTNYIFNKILIYKNDNRIIINFKIFNKLKPVLKKYLAKNILKKLNYPVKPSLSFLNNINKNTVNFEKGNLIVVSKSEYLWFINTELTYQFNKCLLVNDIPSSINTGNINIQFKESFIENPKKHFSFKYNQNDLPVKITSINEKNEHYVKNILENMRIPKILYKETIVFENNTDEIIAVYNNSFYRVSYNFYIKNKDEKAALIIIGRNSSF